jgi:hypothetical protein
MTITLTFKKFGSKPKVVDIQLLHDLTLEQMKKLWEMEQFLNTLPIKVYVDLRTI